MSVDYSAGVILGVRLEEIGFETEIVSVPYKVHDKKGKLTGKTEYEKSWKINFKGKEIIEEGEKLYCDAIEEIINLKKPLILLDNRYYDEDHKLAFKKIVIGVEIANQCGGNIVKELKHEEDIEFVKSELKNQFGVDVEPKLYFYFKIS